MFAITRTPEPDEHGGAEPRPPVSADEILATGGTTPPAAWRRAEAVRDALHRLALQLEASEAALTAYAERFAPSPEDDDPTPDGPA